MEKTIEFHLLNNILKVPNGANWGLGIIWENSEYNVTIEKVCNMGSMT